MAKMPDASTWFKPLWVRIAVTLFCLAWTAWEWLYNKDQFWGILTLGMTGWAIYTFFIAPDKKAGGDGEPKP